jgi:pterin-4a-carbinolamine dehydratase
VPTNRSPEILESDEIARALAAMPGWTGDEQRIQRTIEIPPERVTPLTDAVHRIEAELDHHAQIDNDPAGLTFTVWTHSLSRVTELDLQLAQRIDEAIRNVA